MKTEGQSTGLSTGIFGCHTRMEITASVSLSRTFLSSQSFQKKYCEEPLIQEIMYLDKRIDELAKGKSLEKIFRK